ncbi:MAG TPA: tetratricopeptide repeat protein [Ktedonobacteraceae bacterium]|jgi:Tfp pilus assembly protein PilF|nr:tetratricopeptide repeat protein [Ktedonobacteraceae bacterium]
MYTELIEKGYACLRRSDPQSALSRFQSAIDSEPERPQGYFALAQAYLEQGLRTETRNAFEAALRIDSTYVSARAYLAIELLKDYDLDGAQKELDQALHDEPANLLVHIKYAEYYYRLGFYPRSVELLEQGLKGPHGANEHVVAMARQFLTQAREKSKNLILREPPDPRRLWDLFSRLRPQKRRFTSQNAQSS